MCATQACKTCSCERGTLAVYGITMQPFALLNLNKPAGVTSRRVVDRVQRLVKPANQGMRGGERCARK